MNNREHLTRLQLEELIDMYYDGALSRHEERELRSVLAATTFRSPSIDSARAEMGLESALRRRASRRRFTVAPRAVISVAASLALAIGIGTYVALPRHSGDSTSLTVYVDGQLISNPVEARRIALAEVEESNEFIRRMAIISATEQNRCIQILNTK